MAVPWLSVIDTLIDVTSLALGRRARRRAEELERPAVGGWRLGRLQTRLAAVVVAALKEAFDRDTRRLELEREQMEREHERAERALRLELLRQAGDREIARLRLMAGVACASWIGTLFLSARLIGGAIGARVTLGGGWVLLLAALALSFTAQSRLMRTLARIDDANLRSEDLTSGVPGALVPWLIVLGLAVTGIAVLIS